MDIINAKKIILLLGVFLIFPQVSFGAVIYEQSKIGTSYVSGTAPNGSNFLRSTPFSSSNDPSVAEFQSYYNTYNISDEKVVYIRVKLVSGTIRAGGVIRNTIGGTDCGFGAEYGGTGPTFIGDGIYEYTVATPCSGFFGYLDFGTGGPYYSSMVLDGSSSNGVGGVFTIDGTNPQVFLGYGSFAFQFCDEGGCSGGFEALEPASFLSEISNDSGSLNLRNGSSAAATVLKQFPNGWVVKVATTTDAAGNSIDVDGYRWYGVIDITDGSVGWVAAKDLAIGTTYLSYDASAQMSLESRATSTPYQTKESRVPVILQAVDNYYVASATSSSLYGGGGGHDGLNNFQRFMQGSSYPKELVLAIVGHESAGTLDNEICASAHDGGIGLMQITSTGLKGLGSALKNNPMMGDCKGNSSTSKYYSNTLQGIYANIKDGFRTLQEKYRKKCPDAEITVGALVYTCQDIERVLTTWGYNGKVLTGNYLKQISDSLRGLYVYFPGISYANSDLLIEKLSIANANRIEFKKFSPVEIEVVDSQGRATGFDKNSIIKEEIPFSLYDREAGGGVIFFPQNQYTYRVIGTGAGTYGFRVEFTENNILRTFYATNIPVVPNEVHEYLIDWDALDRGERGVIVYIDTNGDGIVDHTIQSDGTLTEIVPPTITIDSPVGDYYLNATTTVQFASMDASGVETVSATLNGIPVASGQIVTLSQAGTNTLEVVSIDNEGNTAQEKSVFRVTYRTNGFLSPVKSDGIGVYNQGRTLPIKFSLFDMRNNFVPQIIAHLYVAKVGNNVVGTDEIPLSTSVADNGNQFRYDLLTQQYIFNLSTNTMSPGTWQIKAVLDSGQEIKAIISIK